MRLAPIALALAALSLLAGCTSAPPTAETSPPPTPPASATTTPAPDPTPTVAPAPDPADFTAVDPSEFFIDSSALPANFGGWTTADVNFVSPSRNLGCAILGPEHGSLWGCAIKEQNWSFERDSPDDYCYDSQVPCGYGIEATGEDPTHPRQRSDPGFPAAMATSMDDQGSIRVLQYGEMVTFGNVTCFSEETHVTCKNSVSGHGFVISRDENELF